MHFDATNFWRREDGILTRSIDTVSKRMSDIAGYEDRTLAEGKTGGTSTSPSVVTPTPIQEGMAIANEYGILLDDFTAYNPAVGNDCSKLYPTTLSA